MFTSIKLNIYQKKISQSNLKQEEYNEFKEFIIKTLDSSESNIINKSKINLIIKSISLQTKMLLNNPSYDDINVIKDVYARLLIYPNKELRERSWKYFISIFNLYGFNATSEESNFFCGSTYISIAFPQIGSYDNTKKTCLITQESIFEQIKYLLKFMDGLDKEKNIDWWMIIIDKILPRCFDKDDSIDLKSIKEQLANLIIEKIVTQRKIYDSIHNICSKSKNLYKYLDQILLEANINLDNQTTYVYVIKFIKILFPCKYVYKDKNKLVSFSKTSEFQIFYKQIKEKFPVNYLLNFFDYKNESNFNFNDIFDSYNLEYFKIIFRILTGISQYYINLIICNESKSKIISKFMGYSLRFLSIIDVFLQLNTFKNINEKEENDFYLNVFIDQDNGVNSFTILIFLYIIFKIHKHIDIEATNFGNLLYFYQNKYGIIERIGSHFAIFFAPLILGIKKVFDPILLDYKINNPEINSSSIIFFKYLPNQVFEDSLKFLMSLLNKADKNTGYLLITSFSQTCILISKEYDSNLKVFFNTIFPYIIKTLNNIINSKNEVSTLNGIPITILLLEVTNKIVIKGYNEGIFTKKMAKDWIYILKKYISSNDNKENIFICIKNILNYVYYSFYLLPTISEKIQKFDNSYFNDNFDLYLTFLTSSALIFNNNYIASEKLQYYNFNSFRDVFENKILDCLKQPNENNLLLIKSSALLFFDKLFSNKIDSQIEMFLDQLFQYSDILINYLYIFQQYSYIIKDKYPSIGEKIMIEIKNKMKHELPLDHYKAYIEFIFDYAINSNDLNLIYELLKSNLDNENYLSKSKGNNHKSQIIRIISDNINYLLINYHYKNNQNMNFKKLTEEQDMKIPYSQNVSFGINKDNIYLSFNNSKSCISKGKNHLFNINQQNGFLLSVFSLMDTCDIFNNKEANEKAFKKLVLNITILNFSNKCSSNFLDFYNHFNKLNHPRHIIQISNYIFKSTDVVIIWNNQFQDNLVNQSHKYTIIFITELRDNLFLINIDSKEECLGPLLDGILIPQRVLYNAVEWTAIIEAKKINENRNNI